MQFGQKTARASECPLVSILIPTKNSARTLSRTLESINNQTYTNWEVIIVDGFSTDETRTITRRFDRVSFYQHGNERSAQVNFGCGLAKGKYVYYVGSDFVLESTVLEEAVRACEQRVDAVVVHNTSDPTVSYWSKVRKLERDCYRDGRWHIAVRFMRKEDFERAGGFPEALVAAEDYHLHNKLLKLGIKVGLIRAQEIHIGEPRKLKEVVLKHIYYGKLVDRFIQANPGVSWRQLSPIRLDYMRHWRDFMQHPGLIPGFVLYQYVRYASAVLGYLAR